MKLDPDSVLVIFLHTNLAWFGLCFDLRSNLHAARKLTWIYMGINLQAEFFFCFFLFWTVGGAFSMRFRRSAGQNTRDRACAVGCRTRGRTRPGPRAFRAKAACRTAASWVKWQAEVELDRMTFAVFPGPTPGGGGTGLCRGSGPVGLGPWGALGPPHPPTGALPPPGEPQAIDNLPRSSWTGRGRVGQDDVRGVPGPQTRGGRRRPL